MTRIRSVLARAAAVAAIMFTIPAQADPVADFYKSRQVTIYVGYSVGGGYDGYARVLARHMGRNIPGKPEIIIKNRPGAGSLVLTNEIYNVLPRDGTVFGTIGRGILMEPMFGNKKARFDPTGFTW